MAYTKGKEKLNFTRTINTQLLRKTFKLTTNNPIRKILWKGETKPRNTTQPTKNPGKPPIETQL
jgi:hypothetical protein